jgi:hypothetical protein
VRRQDRTRSLLILAAKIAGAVAVVLAIVIVRPFIDSGPSSGANLDPYATGFKNPTFVGFAPGEPRRLYVVEQAGRIRYLLGRRIGGTFLDIRSRVASGGERGLLSVAFSPNYQTDHRFYVDYTDRNGDTRVVEFRSRNGRAVLSTARELLFVKQPYVNHNGGQLQFGPDGLLYVGMGDGGGAGDPNDRAQSLDDRLGKLLRIDPFDPDADWQVVGYGLRNPWRFSFDRATASLSIADVGQDAVEEVSFVRSGRGANFGWRPFEGNRRVYDEPAPGAVAPAITHSHASGFCSITGGYVVRDPAVPSLAGRYVYADLCEGRIRAARLRPGRRARGRVLSLPGVASPSSFGEDSRGRVYVTSLAGPVFRFAAPR